MLKSMLISTILVLFISLSVFAQDKPKEEQKKNNAQAEVIQKEESKKPWNAVCPVKGNPIEEETVTVEYNGKVYGFCCPGCDVKFAKNPEKYAKNLSEDGKKFIGKK